MTPGGKPAPLFTEHEEEVIAQIEAILAFVTGSNPPTIISVKLAAALADRLTELLVRELVHGRGESMFALHLRDGAEVARLTADFHGKVLTMPDELRQAQVG